MTESKGPLAELFAENQWKIKKSQADFYFSRYNPLLETLTKVLRGELMEADRNITSAFVFVQFYELCRHGKDVELGKFIEQIMIHNQAMHFEVKRVLLQKMSAVLEEGLGFVLPDIFKSSKLKPMEILDSLGLAESIFTNIQLSFNLNKALLPFVGRLIPMNDGYCLIETETEYPNDGIPEPTLGEIQMPGTYFSKN
ncbi:hypothetical protein IPJ91_01020 [bacterium]|nr:MAG: hypothetical protein IPJ91_01020 [bacterium]